MTRAVENNCLKYPIFAPRMLTTVRKQLLKIPDFRSSHVDDRAVTKRLDLSCDSTLTWSDQVATWLWLATK